MVPMHRTLIAVAVLVVAPAFAQTGDEWSTFPPAPPAPAPVKPAEPPPPARIEPRVAPPPEPVRTTPPPKAQPTAAPAPVMAADAGVDDADTRIISQKERYLAGTEPHSPSTWGNKFDAPSNGRVTVGQAGVGTVFVPSARLGPAGVVRVSMLGEYLNQLDFPVRSAQNIRSAVTFAASYQPFEWGEIFVSYGAAANSNNRTSPNLIQALGDLSFGIKASKQWAKGFHAGADLRLLTFSGVGNQGVDRFAVGFKPTLLATYDFRALSGYAPFIFTLGLGFTLDTTSGLVTNQRLNASEEFALNVNRYNRFNFDLALELPFPVVTPFFEYTLAAPMGVPNGELTGPDGKFINVSAAMPQQFGLGLKITAAKDLDLRHRLQPRPDPLGGPGRARHAAVELLLRRCPSPSIRSSAVRRSSSTPFARRSWRSPRPRPRCASKAPSPTRRSGKPISGVIVAIAGIKPSATNDVGQYESLPLSAKSVKLSIARDGYKAVEREVAVEPTKPTRVDVALEPDLKKAKFEVSATANKKPIKADITFKGAAEAKLQTPEGAAPGEIELPAGTYTLTASAEGHLAQTRDVQVQAGGKLVVTFDLIPAPKKVLVIFKGDKIEILQQVRFATGKSTILPESFNLLQQVVDAIIKNNVRRVRVEGHTDNRGEKPANQVLSEDRARAVKEYLVAQGIDKDRLESVGYGDSKPIAPNLTARGRELNRRVEFIVLEK